MYQSFCHSSPFSHVKFGACGVYACMCTHVCVCACVFFIEKENTLDRTLTHGRWEQDMVQPLWKTVWQLPSKRASGVYTKELKTKPTSLHLSVYRTFIYINQNMEATNMPISRQMGRCIVVDPVNDVVCSAKRKRATNPCKQREEPEVWVTEGKSQSEKASDIPEKPKLWRQ